MDFCICPEIVTVLLKRETRVFKLAKDPAVASLSLLFHVLSVGAVATQGCGLMSVINTFHSSLV